MGPVPQMFRAVPVHADPAHPGDESAFLQQVHEKQGGLCVGGGKDGGPGGEAALQGRHKLPVGRPGVGQVPELGFLREGVGVQPVQQLQVHPQTPIGKLGPVEVEIHQSGEDEPVPEVQKGQVPVGFREDRKGALAKPLCADQKSIGNTPVAIGTSTEEKLPFTYKIFHGMCLLLAPFYPMLRS